MQHRHRRWRDHDSKSAEDKATGERHAYFEQLVRKTVRKIGYVNDDDIFHADKIFDHTISLLSSLLTLHKAWTPAQLKERKPQNRARAIKGLMFGYACDETPELMPSPIMYAHRLGRELTRIRKSGKVGWLRPDAKSQVSVDLRKRKTDRHFLRRRFNAARAGRKAFGNPQLS